MAVPRYGRTVAEGQPADCVGGPTAAEPPGAGEPTRLDRAAATAFGPLAPYGFVTVSGGWPGCTAYRNARWRVEIDHDWKDGELLVRVGVLGNGDASGEPVMRPLEQLLPSTALKGLRLRRIGPNPSIGMLTARLSDLLVALQAELSGFPR